MSANVNDVNSKSVAFTFKMKQWMAFVKFVQCIWSNTDHCMGNVDANTIKHVSNKKLYITLSTLEKNLTWNWTVLIMKY